MKISHEPSLALIWFFLCGLTIFSFAIFEGASWRMTASVLVVLISALKARLIIWHFMHIRNAKFHWRILYEVWNVLVTFTIVAGFLVHRL